MVDDIATHIFNAGFKKSIVQQKFFSTAGMPKCIILLLLWNFDTSENKTVPAQKRHVVRIRLLKPVLRRILWPTRDLKMK